ncbi:MAG: sigma-70 family RNA polymerase sigma factor [Planctomycetota bacterium]|nr:sigma-70 family RNA polymerase sigma factor [Planctomycetota bacterium]
MEALSMATDPDRETLVRRHHLGVWRYLRFLGADRALADDLTQETFLVFLRKPFNFMGHESTAGYLRGIARYVWLEERRSTVTTAELDAADAAFAQHAGPSEGDDYLDALRECEKTLAGKAREAVQLQYRDRLSLEQIGETLDMKPNGVKTMLQRARQHLRECVERRLK